jgi:hypothetical protein
MMYKKGTLEEYLIENPIPIDEESVTQVRKWTNPMVDNEYLWSSDNGTISEDEKFNIVAVWINSIMKPTTRKYWINKNGDYSYGFVDVGCVMNSGLTKLEIFDNEEDYLARLEELGIIIEDI